MQKRRTGTRARTKRVPRKFQATKVTFDGREFDSKTELAYYLHLRLLPEVEQIELQPQFQILSPYEVECKRCRGNRQVLNRKTGNLNQCSLCKGKGKREKAGMTYTADFRVTYTDGYTEVIDVKGFSSSRDFPVRRRLFEKMTGMELIIVERKGKEWLRK
ncbi:DUF1064 domain-containing protein [Indiicoccus explosivorum]|uniref:DUF1064 domain-containing protein n=1 Tax=Indiicoccus explosivorum TaxID=1917864 RepID=UPI001F4E4E06|nr:DUF1064 domain-containing protein [Indiicoccus explosivorum]